MEHGICLHSVIPVRSAPSHKSELVTQVLFGELYRIVEKDQTWCRIKLTFDDYEGWIDMLQYNPIGEQEYLRLFHSVTFTTLDLVQLVSHETGRTMIPVVIGSSLPGFDESRIRVGQDVFLYDGLVSETGHHKKSIGPRDMLKTRQQLIEDAMLYLNAPYLWGGRTPFGIDCSGFVQMVYKLQGFTLLRDASQQATQGEIISFLAESCAGDLAFFDDADGKVTHVGILVDHHRIVHCSGQVQVDTIDHEGIYSDRLKRYTHRLRLIRRII